MRPFLSIIVPYHDTYEDTIRLLNTIAGSVRPPVFEVIVVDDASEKSLQLTDISLQKKKRMSVRIIRMVKNKGPAAARNRGAKIARGKFLLFLDSDVEVFPDTLHNLAAIYLDDPDIVAVTGVWVKEQRNATFFPNFKALRDWSYWINERDKSGYYFLFSTRVASIKKAVFMRLGGFSESYTAALVEDIELTYRIARRYAIIFAPNVRVRHEFESFWPIAKKYFLRAYHWTRLYRKRKKFDPVATTFQEAVTTLSAVAGLGFMGISIIVSAVTYWIISGVDPNWSLTTLRLVREVNAVIIAASGVLLFFHFYLIRKFLVFMYNEKGFVFALKGFFVGLVLYCFIFAGALWGRLK